MKFGSHSIPFRNSDEAKKEFQGRLDDWLDVMKKKKQRLSASILTAARHTGHTGVRLRMRGKNYFGAFCPTCAPHNKYLLSRRSLLDEIFWFAKLCYKDIVSHHSVPKKWKNSSIIINEYIIIPHYSLVINKLTSAFFI